MTRRQIDPKDELAQDVKSEQRVSTPSQEQTTGDLNHSWSSRSEDTIRWQKRHKPEVSTAHSSRALGEVVVLKPPEARSGRRGLSEVRNIHKLRLETNDRESHCLLSIYYIYPRLCAMCSIIVDLPEVLALVQQLTYM